MEEDGGQKSENRGQQLVPPDRDFQLSTNAKIKEWRMAQGARHKGKKTEIENGGIGERGKPDMNVQHPTLNRRNLPLPPPKGDIRLRPFD